MDDNNELISLNAEQLDIEELERRLELAAGLIVDAPWLCGVHASCPQLTCGVDKPAEK